MLPQLDDRVPIQLRILVAVIGLLTVSGSLLTAAVLTAAAQQVADAEALLKAPLCPAMTKNEACRRIKVGVVSGGYDTSDVGGERHIEVRFADGTQTELASAVIGPAPTVGSSIDVVYWRTNAVDYFIDGRSEIVQTSSHPAVRARTSRVEAWFLFWATALSALALYRVIVFVRPLDLFGPMPPPFTLRKSPWPVTAVAALLVAVSLYPFAADGLEPQIAHHVVGGVIAGVVLLSLLLLSHASRGVHVGIEGVTYRKRFIAFRDIIAVGIEIGKRGWDQHRIVTLTSTLPLPTMTINTILMARQDRARLIDTIATQAPRARLDAAAMAVRDGGRAVVPVHANGPWEGQNRGCSASLIYSGVCFMLPGLVVEFLGVPNAVAFWLFGVGTILLGLGLHRNLKVLLAYFGRQRGMTLFVGQIAAFVVAYALELPGEFGSNLQVRLFFRLLSVVPFLLIYRLIWLPLSRIGPAAFANERADRQA